MARYFLHLRTPKELIPDSAGVELAHLGRLHDSMTKVAADLVRDNAAARAWSFEVQDEQGRTVLTEKVGNLVGSAPEAPVP